MLPYGDSRFTKIALGLFFLIVIGYGYFEARALLFGPRIDIESQMTVSHDKFVRIQGETQHIASLSMNGKAISVTKEGIFDEPYLLAPGSNRIYLEAKDKYGNTTTRVIQIYYSTASQKVMGSEPLNAATTSKP